MASKPDERRRRLFDNSAPLVAALSPEHQDHYICPLCLRAFDRTALEQPVDLTLEDVPPQALGGKPLLLTCVDCNNLGGSELDCHAEHRRAQEDFVFGTHSREIKGRLIVDGVPLRSRFRRDDDRFIVLGVPKANRPETAEQHEAILDQWVAEGAVGHEFVVEFESFSPTRADLSWVRAAYLAAFALFGYTYLLWPDLQRLREQLQNAAGEHVPVKVLINRERDRASRTIAIVERWPRADSPKALLVVMGDHAVPLPATSEAGFFERLQAELAATPADEIPVAQELGWPRRPLHLADRRDLADSASAAAGA